MTLLFILLAVFCAVGLMVVLGERFGKPLDTNSQQKYSKIIMVVVFLALFSALIKAMM